MAPGAGYVRTMRQYDQHCPMARAAELVGESWTLLIVRELLRGERSAEAISQCITGISSGVLAARLSTLQRAEVITKRGQSGEQPVFRLTPAGLELRPLVEQLGVWGQRWLPPPRNGQLAPALLVQDITSEIDATALPRRPVAVEILLSETPEPSHWWLVLSLGKAEAHLKDPGIPVVVRIAATLSALTNVWLGHTTWLHAVRSSSIRIHGRPDMVRSVLAWLGFSRLAKIQRAEHSLPRS